MKINILYIVWGLGYGGAERFILNVIKNLDENKYSVTVFSDDSKKGPMYQDFVNAGADVIFSNKNPWLNPIGYRNQIREIIGKKKINIVHANNDQGMFFALKGVPENVKFIAHAHNTTYQFTRIKTISDFVTRKFSKSIIKRADLRLSCGEDAGTATFLGKDFIIIPNGTDIEKYKFDKNKRNALRKSLKIDDDATVLLSIGRVVKQKNHDFLIDVFNEYQKKNKNSKLVIIGDGDLKNALEKKVLNLNLQNDVIILPGQKNIEDYYSAADLFVMTSLFEGMPYVTVEAQANGLRCVYSDKISKEADHSKDSTFISLEESPKTWAEKISSLDLSRKQMRVDSVKSYDIKTIAKKLDEIYSKELAGGEND